MVVSLHVTPAAFEAAVASVRSADFRSELSVEEIGAPTGLAPDALALAADVDPDGQGSHDTGGDLGTGRFILLHDPAEPEAWRGDFRIVCFAQAALEPDIGVDPMLSDVAWSWLTDALDARGASFDYASGTATTINSRGYGELEPQGPGAQIEIRASWTPRDLDFGAHAAAWGDLLCLLAGLPPVDSEHVSVLRLPRTSA